MRASTASSATSSSTPARRRWRSPTRSRGEPARAVARTEISGIGGGAAANVYRVDTIAFGANVLHNVRVVTGLDESGHSADISRDGLIGFDVLAGAIVDLNLDDGTLRLLDPNLVQPDTSKGFVVPVDLSSGPPRVVMTVGGKVPVLATLDSGNPLHVRFSRELVSRDHVSFFSDPQSLAHTLEYYGVNGVETDTCGQLPSLEFGGITYRPVPACESGSFERSNVLVGLDFLRAFNIVFDYPDGELLMTPRKNRS
jgi:hypothetical protein